ncbi:MAG TPA: GNAT family N-acetyltransferase [Gaiellaceae bacterium]|nr:GNAT family N-acetyltransferase [Gaiellaceae bacterium]
MLVREARREDARAIAALLAELGYPVAADAIPRRLARLDACGDLVLVAEVDGVVAALAHLHVSPAIEYDRPAAKLSALVVGGRRRRSGIGRALVEAVEAEARSRGCGLLFLTTAERRANAHTFYERLGFERTGRRYAKLFD